MLSQNAAGKSSLHPALQAALASLDVTLESELERFRNLTGQTSGEQHQITLNHTPEGLTADFGTAPSATETPQHQFALTSDASEQTQLELFFDLSDSITLTNELDHLLSERTALATSNPESNYLSTEPESSLSTPAESAHFLLSTTDTAHTVDDYLASSEALRQNLATPTTPVSPHRPPKKLVTPWRIAAAISLVGLCVVAFNVYQRLKERPAAADASSSLKKTAIPQSAPTSAAAEPQNKTTGPNLSQQEFVDLNLANLSRIASSASKSQPEPVANQTTQANVAPLAESKRSRTTPESTVASAPKVEDTRYFFVLVPYTGADELKQLQAVVPDAFVANFPEGTRVQLAAFNRLQDAQNMVRSIETRGISASVRSPQGGR